MHGWMAHGQFQLPRGDGIYIYEIDHKEINYINETKNN